MSTVHIPAGLDELDSKRGELDGELTLIPGAAHLFEEPGTLQQAARCAASWFVQHL